MSVNLMSRRQEHRRWCHDPAHHVSDWGRVGDVRRCTHGKLQIAIDISSRRVAIIPPGWRDLSPILDPINYWRARRALRG